MHDVWVTAPCADGTIELTLRSGPPRPLVAVVTEAELDSLDYVLRTVADAVRRNEFSRIQLGAAFHDKIGRDPFRRASAFSPAAKRSEWLDNLGCLVGGVLGATSPTYLWFRVLAAAFAGYGLYGLIRLSRRRFSSAPIAYERRPGPRLTRAADRPISPDSGRRAGPAQDRGTGVDRIWSVVATENDCVELTLEADRPQPLVAFLTGAELHSLIEPLRPVDEAVRRNALDRAQLARICRDTIGRDPFEDESAARESLTRPALGAELAMATGGALVAATGHGFWWQRLLAGAVAAYGLYGLARRAWRRRTRD